MPYPRHTASGPVALLLLLLLLLAVAVVAIHSDAQATLSASGLAGKGCAQYHGKCVECVEASGCAWKTDTTINQCVKAGKKSTAVIADDPSRCPRLEVIMYTSSTPCESTKAAFGAFLSEQDHFGGAAPPLLNVYHAYTGMKVGGKKLMNLNSIVPSQKDVKRDNGGELDNQLRALAGLGAVHLASYVRGEHTWTCAKNGPGNVNMMAQLAPFVAVAPAYANAMNAQVAACAAWLQNKGNVREHNRDGTSDFSSSEALDARLELDGNQNHCMLGCVMAMGGIASMPSCSVAVVRRRGYDDADEPHVGGWLQPMMAFSGAHAAPAGLANVDWVNLATVDAVYPGDATTDRTETEEGAADDMKAGATAWREAVGLDEYGSGADFAPEIPSFHGHCSEDKLLTRIRALVTARQL